MFKRGKERTVKEGERQKHSGVSALIISLSFQRTLSDVDVALSEDGKFQWKDDAIRIEDRGM